MGRGRLGLRDGRREQGQGGGRGHGGRGGRYKRAAARMLKGRPQPTIPHAINKELGIEGVDDPLDDGVNIIGGGPLVADAEFASDDSRSPRDADVGSGNSTRAYVAGGHTRALGGGGLFGISKRKQERKAAATAAKQRNAQRFKDNKVSRNWHQAAAVPDQGDRKSSARCPAAAVHMPSGGSSKNLSNTAVEPRGSVRKGKRKRVEVVVQKPVAAKNARFEAFLGDLVQQPGGDAAIAAEKARFRQLAKKLKIKGSRVSRDDDGLDAFTSGLSTAAMDSGSDDDASLNGHDNSLSDDFSAESDDDAGETSSSDESHSGVPLLESDSRSDDEQLLSDDSQSDDPLDDGSSEEEDVPGEECSSGSGSDMSDLEARLDAPTAINAIDPNSRQTGTKSAATGGVYVPPALRGKSGRSQGGDARLLQQVRGLLNRLAESNMQGFATQVVDLMDREGRRTVSDIVTAELLSAAAEGPRASDAFAAVAAAFICGVSAIANAQEVAARFMEALAAELEGARSRHSGLACTNLVMVAVHGYLCGMVPPPLLFNLLHHLIDRFEEQDVAMMSVALRAAGLHLRNADPAMMRDFLVDVHSRAAIASKVGAMTTRAEVMLSLLMDIKNNRVRGGGSSNVVLTAGTTKWLKAAGAPAVILHGLTWQKLLAPNKKGLWWTPTVGEVLPAVKLGSLTEGAHDERLLQLAAAARMNTDTRRAVFCAVMGSEDAADAFERLLRLSLKGEATRELIRVPLECALQEAAWNPYYCHLLARLTASATSHLVTLQYCLWDHFKTVEQGEARRTAQLARLTGTLISGGILPLSVLKVVQFDETLAVRETVFWRLMFEHLLLTCSGKDAVTAVFTRLVSNAAGKPMTKDLSRWLQRTFAPWAAKRPTARDPNTAAQFSQRLDAAVRVLSDSAA